MSECKKCGQCCKFIVIKLPHLKKKLEHNNRLYLDHKKFYRLHNCELLWHVDEKYGRIPILKVFNKCIELNSENQCNIYEERPLGCKQFPGDKEFIHFIKECGLSDN